jgi:hypothetical protein
VIEQQVELCFKRHNKQSHLESAKVLSVQYLSSIEESSLPNTILFQSRARKLLQSKIWQYTLGLIIVANFAVNICQASLQVASASEDHTIIHSTDSLLAEAHRIAQDKEYLDIFNVFDIIFTVVSARPSASTRASQVGPMYRGRPPLRFSPSSLSSTCSATGSGPSSSRDGPSSTSPS